MKQVCEATAPGKGLRIKTLGVLVVMALLILLFALLISESTLKGIRDGFGTSFARNHVLQKRQQIITPILRELALSQRLADSEFTRRWYADENNPQAKAAFFDEADGYQRSFSSHAYSAVLAGSNHHYFNGDTKPYSRESRYTLDPAKATDRWFYATLKLDGDYHLNVDQDEVLKVTKLWFNVPVRDKSGKIIGITGTGLDLTTFLQSYIHSTEVGITNIIIDGSGAILAHPDPNMINYTVATGVAPDKTLHHQLANDAERQALDQVLKSLAGNAESSATLEVKLAGSPRLLALAYIPELKWYVVSAADLRAVGVIDSKLLLAIVALGLFLIVALIAATMIGFDRLVLAPLARLNERVREIAAGAYHIRLSSKRQDELGELTRTIDVMARCISQNMDTLEQRVDERTHELLLAHEQLEAAHRKVTDSIRYASFFQSALLPDAALARDFPGEHFVLWAPRDVVGGDLYLYRAFDNGHLIGLVDCSGHGVPGAFMTMIAHAALDQALRQVGPEDPALLLSRFDETVRRMLPPRQRFGRIATEMDMALCFADTAAGCLRYAGAKLPLRWCDSDGPGKAPAERRSIGDRKPGQFYNAQIALVPGRSFYLCSDGILDQNGGAQGFSLGEAAVMTCLQAHAAAPLTQQRAALVALLADYQGQNGQRDDITVIGFRFAPLPSLSQEH